MCVVAVAIMVSKVSHSTPLEHLSQIRKRNKRTRDDMFQEILQVSATSENETRAWRIILADIMDKRSGQEKSATKGEGCAAGDVCTSQIENK